MRLNSIDSREIRRFGLIALLFFGTLCAVGVWRSKVVPIVLFGGLGLMGLGFSLIPKPMTPIYRAWLNFARLIGKTITMLMLTLVYYLVVTPTAFIKRILGGAPLALKPDPTRSSYWVKRSEPVQPEERFSKRY